MKKDLRIVLVSCSAAVGVIDVNIRTMTHWMDRAKDVHADIVCFPELSLSGYGLKPEAVRTGPEIDDVILDSLRREARRTDMILLAGWAAYHASGRPWICHGVVTPQGKTGIYRKTHLGPPERAAYTAGEDVSVFRLEDVTIGIQLCYDAHFPELTSIMAANGMDILFVPHASPHGSGRSKIESWKRHLVARAYDNAVFVMACNLSGTNDSGLSFPGAAFAIDPSGLVIDSAALDPEGMMVVDARAAALHAVRNHPMRYFAPNRRPELYGNVEKHGVIDIS